ncbi:TonB-dependent receptor plug domain-containing protein [Pendulispora rubella]|uniref:TonB-dependent receptor plug domain-containing protein n=1 Tax=Pendulispora rubella TaxID=2741070 RepID=A0ABZ2KQK5_9BACT
MRWQTLAATLATLAMCLVCAQPAKAQAADTVPPTLTSAPEVPYPQGAHGDAVIVLVLTVNADGTVRSVVPETAQEPFASAASEAAMTFRFQPATRNGTAVAAKVRMELAFRAPPPEPEPEPAPLPAPEPPRRHAPAPMQQVQEVRVGGERVEPSRTATLSRAEVREIPGTFGDPFRAIEMMPGVTPIVSGLPFFFVRGAPPGNVGYFLDGVRVPLLFHVGAGPSVIHPALVERVDLYPGGYPARFGRYAGGIVSGEMVAPRPETHGEYNLRAFDAGAWAETGFGNGRGTISLGGRYSYTAALLSRLASDTVLDYWDYQFRATYDLTPDDRIGVFAFGSYDFLGQKTPTETLPLFAAEFHRVDLRYDRRLGENSTMRTAFTLGLDRTRLSEGRQLQDRMVGGRSEIVHRISPRTMVRVGTDVQMDSYAVIANQDELSPSASRVSSYFPSRTDLTMGARADVVYEATPGFEITTGARVDFFASQGSTAVGIDPRLMTRTNVGERLRVLTALGLAHQPPAFVVPVPGFQPGGLRGGLQRSIQESLGLELVLGAGTTFTVSAFHNTFFDMSDPLGSLPQDPGGCAPGAFPADSLGGDSAGFTPGWTPYCGARFPPGTVGPDRSGGSGQGASSRGEERTVEVFEVRSRGTAYGLELFLKRKLTSRLGGFLSYTLSRSTRYARGEKFVASFDRTHVANAAVALDLGRRWRAGGRVVFYTGVPRADNPAVTSTERLPSFFRIDLRLEKRWQIGKTSWLSVVAEWMNVTLNKEAISTDCTLRGCAVQTVGPITIPSLGVEGGF